MGAGSSKSKSKSKLSRGKSEAIVQTDVTIDPSTPGESNNDHSNNLLTPQNRIIVRLSDPRSATSGIVRTPIFVEQNLPATSTVNRPRYLETNLDEVLPYYEETPITTQRPSLSPFAHCGGDCIINVSVGEGSPSSPPTSNHHTENNVASNKENLENSRESAVEEMIFDNVILDCQEKVIEIRSVETVQRDDTQGQEENRSCAISVEISVAANSTFDDVAKLSEELSDGNIILESSSSNKNLEEPVKPSPGNSEIPKENCVYTNPKEKDSSDTLPFESGSIAGQSNSTNDSSSAVANPDSSRCCGECGYEGESWCQCDTATAIMLSSLRAIGLKEPGEPTLPLPPLPDSLSDDIYCSGKARDWLDDAGEESEVFVDEETKAVAEQLLALSQSVGAYSRQLMSADSQAVRSARTESDTRIFNNALPIIQKNEGILLTHNNLTRSSPVVYKDPVGDIVTPKNYSTVAKKLHFTPELSDSEKRMRQPLATVCGNVTGSGGSYLSVKSQGNDDTPVGVKLRRGYETNSLSAQAEVENTPPGRKSKPKPYSACWNDNEATVLI